MKLALLTTVVALYLGTAAAIDCSAGGTSCVTLCAGGSAYLNCAGSTCKLNASGWYGTCQCICHYGKRGVEGEAAAAEVEAEEEAV